MLLVTSDKFAIAICHSNTPIPLVVWKQMKGGGESWPFGEFRNSVASISVGGNSPSIGGWIV